LKRKRPEQMSTAFTGHRVRKQRMTMSRPTSVTMRQRNLEVSISPLDFGLGSFAEVMQAVEG